MAGREPAAGVTFASLVLQDIEFLLFSLDGVGGTGKACSPCHGSLTSFFPGDDTSTIDGRFWIVDEPAIVCSF